MPRTYKRKTWENQGNGNYLNMCEAILGYDFNAFHLWYLMQDIPTGCFARHRARMNLDLPARYLGKKQPQNEWTGIPIRHKYNGKKDRLDNEVYQWMAGVQKIKQCASFMEVTGIGIIAEKPKELKSVKRMGRQWIW